MTNKTEILEAHVQFELQRYRDETLKATLQEEISALYAWLAQVKTRDVLNPAQIMAWVQRNVIDIPLTDELTSFIRENVIVTYEALREDKTTVAEILPKPVFEQAVEAVASMETLRHELAHQVVSNTVYSMLISHVLYQGIKGFVLSENAISKNIPGATSLVKMGQSALNAAAPKLEKNVDKHLIAFINTNIQQVIADSEQFLDKALDDKLIHKLGEELWSAQSTKTLSNLTSNIDTAALDQVVTIVQDFWLHYRQTPLFYDLVQGVVHSFFLRYAKKPATAILDDIGITPDMLAAEAHVLLAPFAAQAIATGFLEARIRHRLDAFYSACFGT